MLHFQGGNSFIYLENMSSLARVDVSCIHDLKFTLPCCPPQCVNNGVSTNLFRIKVKQAVKYKNVRPKRQNTWHETYMEGEYHCS